MKVVIFSSWQLCACQLLFSHAWFLLLILYLVLFCVVREDTSWRWQIQACIHAVSTTVPSSCSMVLTRVCGTMPPAGHSSITSTDVDCPSSHCLCNETFLTNSLVNNESVCEERWQQDTTTFAHSTPTHPTSRPDNLLDSKARQHQDKTTTKQKDETKFISTRQDRTKSTPTQPASLGISRCPTIRGMLGSIAVCEIDEWVPCFTIDLTDRLADALDKERQYSNGEAYYHTEWSIVTG